MEKTWSDADLRVALKRYEQACIAAGCAPITVWSYVHYAGLFVDWRVGESHTRGAQGPNHPKTLAASFDELMTDVAHYRPDLRQAGLAPRSEQTYVVHASQFVRWLDGRFEPCTGARGVRQRGARPDAGRTSAPTPVHEPATDPEPATDGTWTWEGNVQTAVVRWLEADGWTVLRQADTRSGEHGLDIEARRGNERLAVEVKGYPQATYARGVRAGEAKRWHPGAQARTYFGTGLHAAVIQRDRATGEQVALALPDLKTYRGLFDQVRSALRDLGIRAFLVGQDGSVRELRR